MVQTFVKRVAEHARRQLLCTLVIAAFKAKIAENFCRSIKHKRRNISISAFLLSSDRRSTLLRVTSVRFGHKLEKFITVQTKISSLRKTVMSDKLAMQKCKKN